MKYKLINKITREEHLCEKVSVDGFDYYVSDEKVSGMLAYNPLTNKMEFFASHPKYNESGNKVIATNNPNIAIPKVVDEVKRTSFLESMGNTVYMDGYRNGYNKSQETHSFNEEDMFEFSSFYTSNMLDSSGKYLGKSPKELLQIWREQQPKIVYYNE